MINHQMQLASILDLTGASTVCATLRALPGVESVEAVSGLDVVAVRFDQGRTSPQEMGQVLARVGYPERARHGAGGSCCGGCGG